MYSAKLTLCCILYIAQITMSHQLCWAQKSTEAEANNRFLVLKEQRKELCHAGYEVCCADGCCVEIAQIWLFSILWKISIAVLCIFIGVVIFIYGFYYFYEKITWWKNDNENSASMQMQIFNVESVGASAPREALSGTRRNCAAPPPAYNVAVHLPRRSCERVPSYEEAIKASKGMKKF